MKKRNDFKNKTQTRHFRIKGALPLLFLLAALMLPALPVPADTINWYQTEQALGIKNCVISNAELSAIRVSAVSLDRKKATIRVGQMTKLTASVSPSYAANQTVKWKSSNKKVAAVTKSGWVKGKKKGTCTITAWSVDGKKKATCKITVKKAPASGVKPIALEKSSLKLMTGQTKYLAVRLKTTGTTSPVTWTTSNANVVSVDQNGRLTGLRGGSAVITARLVNSGKTVRCRVNVGWKYGISRLSWKIRRASSATTYSGQGSGVNHGTYFKLWYYNTVQLYDFATGALKSEFTLDVRHGNLIDFDTVSGTHGGLYDDAYVSCTTNPAMVNVYRFSDGGAERVRSYVFPLEKTGYNAGHVLDPSARRIYMLGYTKDSFYNPAGNEMILSVWDLDQTVRLAEGFYRPQFVRSFRLPFILTLQGQCLHDGELYVMSSHWVQPQTIVYVIDPSSGKVKRRISYLPTELKHIEMESIFFHGGKMYMDKNSAIYQFTF